MKSFRRLLPFATLCIITLPLFFVSAKCFAQEALSAGKKVFVSVDSREEAVNEVKEELIQRIEEWKYWKVTGNKEQADFIMDLDAGSSKGITLTSWGGTSMRGKVRLFSKDGAILWESPEFQSSPNGSNGFNSKKAVAKKIVKALKRKFRQ